MTKTTNSFFNNIVRINSRTFLSLKNVGFIDVDDIWEFVVKSLDNVLSLESLLWRSLRLVYKTDESGEELVAFGFSNTPEIYDLRVKQFEDVNKLYKELRALQAPIPA